MIASVQLELPFSEWQGEPWAGRSPRTLTRGYLGLFLRREPEQHASFFVDPNQIDMWPAAENVPWVYQGAPLLKGGL